MSHLRDYLLAWQRWWTDRPRWPAPPTVRIVANAETAKAMENASRAMDAFGAAIDKQVRADVPKRKERRDG